MRESLKQMKDVKKSVNNNNNVWSNMCFETFAWFLSTDERNANLCGLFWLKGNFCDLFKHHAMKTWGKIDSSEKTQTTLFKTLIT